MPSYPNLNFVGSSGFGTLPGGRYGRLTTVPNYDVAATDYGIYDPVTGKVVSLNTGKPWTGREPRTGVSYSQGVPSAQSAESAAGVEVPFSGGQTINPNDPTQRYKPVDIVKSPDVAAGASDLMKQFNTAAANSLQGFADYLNQFKGETGKAFQAGQSAVAGIEPLTKTLTGLQDRYSSALGGDVDKLNALLASDAAAQRGIVQQASDILPQYDTAAQAIADRQMQNLTRQVGRYKMGTGTPTSLGTDEERMLAQAATDVYLPLHQAQIQRQYDLLQNLALPVQRDITGKAISAVTQFDPYVAAQQFQTGTATAQTIQQLRQLASTMGYENAQRYMTSLGVPAQIQQQILAGLTGTLGALGQIEDLSRYRGLQDVLGTYPASPVGFSNALPAYPTYAPSRAGLVRGGGGNAPIDVPSTVTPAAAPAMPTDPNAGLSLEQQYWVPMARDLGIYAPQIPDYRTSNVNPDLAALQTYTPELAAMGAGLSMSGY